MHYIVGTSFSVAPNNKSTLSPDRRFKVGHTYTLSRILKNEDSFIYTFVCANDRSKLEIIFKTCNEADQVISKIKKEQLPVYYVREETSLED
jgi:hypothetical protein